MPVPICKVVIYRDNVNAFPCQSVQIYRQCSDQRLTFTGCHFSDLSLVQDEPAQQLRIEVPQFNGTFCGFADDRKSFR